MGSDESEFLTIAEAAAFKGWTTQNVYYHFRENLKDYGLTAAASGRNPSLRVSREELVNLRRKNAKPQSEGVGSSHGSEPATPSDIRDLRDQIRRLEESYEDSEKRQRALRKEISELLTRLTEIVNGEVKP